MKSQLHSKNHFPEYDSRDKHASHPNRKEMVQVQKASGDYTNLSHKTALPELARDFISTIQQKFPCEYYGLYLLTQTPDLYQVINYRFQKGLSHIREYRSMETRMEPYLENIRDKGFYYCAELTNPPRDKEDWRYPLEGILFLEEIKSYYAFPLRFDNNHLGLLVAGNPLQSQVSEIVSKSLDKDIQLFSKHISLLFTQGMPVAKSQSDGLARINRVLIENNNANEALKEISGIIRELFKSDICILFEYQEIDNRFVVNHSIGLPEEASRFLLSLDLKVADFRLANILSISPGPVIVEDIPKSNLVPKDIVQLFGFKSGLDIPFRVGDDLLGSLTLFYSRGYHQFTDEQIKMAEEINTLVTVAFENARLFRDRESQTRISKTLVKISKALTETLEPEEVFKRITRLTRETLNSDYCILLAWDADSDYFVPQYMEGIQ